mgnify:CR=1 FL=1
MTREPTVAVGRISRPHGIRGELAVTVLTEVASRFAPGSVVLLDDGRSLTVTASKPRSRNSRVAASEMACRVARRLRDRRSGDVDMRRHIPHRFMD